MASPTPLTLRLDDETRDALAKWAAAEDRSMAAQARVVLRGAIPAKFFTNQPPEGETL